MTNAPALSCDVLVVGGGAAGLAAATAAADRGARVIVCEREDHLGGILEQCIHNGFGLHRFGEELTGPEYAERDKARVAASDLIDVHLGTTVLSCSHDASGTHHTRIVSSACGIATVTSRSIVLACGCRERTRGQVNIAGTRPAGVHTAGSAQRLCNCDGVLVGKRVVILGSGDIGLIMARRMTWEGADVLMVCELADAPGGLRRNIVQCLDDNDIPLHLSTTVTRVFGHDRLEAVELADVDPSTMRPIPGTARRVECDCLLLSVGLIPENDVAASAGVTIDRATAGPAVDETLQTSVGGVFVAGNELHVHDLVDFVSEEGSLAGQRAADHALGNDVAAGSTAVCVICGDGVGSLTPQRIVSSDDDVTIRLRTRIRLDGCALVVRDGDREVARVRRRIVVPSEMQTIRLKASALSGLTGPLVVSCEPATQEGR